MSDPKPNEAAPTPPPGEMEFIMKMLRGQIDPIYPPTPEEIEAAGLALELAEAAEVDASNLIESICGTADNSQEVEQYDGTLGVTQAFVAEHQGEVGQLQWNNNLGAIYNNPGTVNGARWCTGTLIANDLFLTAGHCFDQTPNGWQVPRVNGTQNPISPQEIATNMRVNFNYQRDPAGNLRAEQSYAVTQLVEYRLGGHDFAIVRVAGNPGATWGTTPVAQNDAAVGDMLCIIQHPAGLPKRIEAGPLSALVGNFIRYNDVDTLGGSSGSGILGPNGTIVGVHTNGGCNAQMTGHNFGLRVSVLRANSPTIQNLPPTLNIKKIVDDPQPNFKKFRDDVPKRKISDDVPKRKVVDDPGGIKKIADDGPKLKLTDDPPTNFKKVVDDGPKLKVLDDPIGPGGKNFADPKAGMDPIGPGGLIPVVRPQGAPGQEAAPFILSTPHHAEVGGETGADAAAQLAEIEAALQQVAQQYAELVALYQALAGGQ